MIKPSSIGWLSVRRWEIRSLSLKLSLPIKLLCVLRISFERLSLSRTLSLPFLRLSCLSSFLLFFLSFLSFLSFFLFFLPVLLSYLSGSLGFNLLRCVAQGIQLPDQNRKIEKDPKWLDTRLTLCTRYKLAHSLISHHNNSKASLVSLLSYWSEQIIFCSC